MDTVGSGSISRRHPPRLHFSALGPKPLFLLNNKVFLPFALRPTALHSCVTLFASRSIFGSA
jgi:hypothetical protein